METNLQTKSSRMARSGRTLDEDRIITTQRGAAEPGRPAGNLSEVDEARLMVMGVGMVVVVRENAEEPDIIRTTKGNMTLNRRGMSLDDDPTLIRNARW